MRSVAGRNVAHALVLASAARMVHGFDMAVATRSHGQTPGDSAPGPEEVRGVRPVVAVCAGGRSVRMGRDKAMIVLGGQTLLERAASAAVRAGADTFVIGRPRPDSWRGPHVPFAPDDRPDQGPIGGLVTALRRAAAPVALIPCDLPRISSAEIAWLLGLSPPPAGAVVVRAEGQVQPLFAIYDEAVLPVAETLIGRGSRSLMRLLDALDVRIVDAPDAFAAALRDADVPADLPTE